MKGSGCLCSSCWIQSLSTGWSRVARGWQCRGFGFCIRADWKGVRLEIVESQVWMATWIQTLVVAFRAEKKGVDSGTVREVTEKWRKGKYVERIPVSGLGNWVEDSWCHSLRQGTIAEKDSEAGGSSCGKMDTPSRQVPCPHSGILNYIPLDGRTNFVHTFFWGII